VTALPARPSRDLTAVAALALLGLALALLPGSGWVEGAVLVLLVLVLPGYALAAALFQPRSIPAAERTVYSIALGIAVVGLSALVVQVLFNLDRGLWVGLLLAATLVACWAAQRRRELLPFESAPPRVEPPSVNPLAVVAMLLAVGIAVAAFSIAVHSTKDSRADAHFAELWVLPRTGADAGPVESAVSIGVGNHEGRRVSFRLRATRGKEVVARWTVRLARGERWQTSLRTPRPSATAPLRVTLLRDGRVYREAFLTGEAES
jgi:uncharacterized membrane protein